MMVWVRVRVWVVARASLRHRHGRFGYANVFCVGGDNGCYVSWHNTIISSSRAAAGVACDTTTATFPRCDGSLSIAGGGRAEHDRHTEGVELRIL